MSSIKPGVLTTEFYITVGTILSVVGVGFEAISKTDFVNLHPALAAGIAIVTTVVAGFASIAYGIGRSIVKASDNQPVG